MLGFGGLNLDCDNSIEVGVYPLPRRGMENGIVHFGDDMAGVAVPAGGVKINYELGIIFIIPNSTFLIDFGRGEYQLMKKILPRHNVGAFIVGEDKIFG